jgi:hypothetical protein
MINKITISFDGADTSLATDAFIDLFPRFEEYVKSLLSVNQNIMKLYIEFIFSLGNSFKINSIEDLHYKIHSFMMSKG